MTHLRHQLDDLIHTPVRFSLMASLAAAEEVEFKAMRDNLEVSDSLLSKHIQVLEQAGYVTVRKGHIGKRPRTWYSMTPLGRQAFETHYATLRSIATGQNPRNNRAT